MPLLTPPAAILDIADALERAGYETWCVGGAVRDALLGHPHLDWDLATAATPEQVRAVFGRRRTIPVGIEFGTVGVLDQGGRLHEVTTFRRDVRTDGRHAEVEFGVSLEDDLARRDFTINAIAYSPRRDELRDPFDGTGDLSRRVVRAVGDAEARMREDRLRALRAIRFAGRFGFEIEAATLAAIEHSAPHLGRLSAERVKQEIEKTMEQVRCAGRSLALWRDTGVLAVLVPPLADVDDVTIGSLDHLLPPGPPRRPRRKLDRLTALFARVPAGRVRGALSDLRFSRGDTNWIVALVERVQREEPALLERLSSGDPLDDRAVRRMVSRVGRMEVGAFARVVLARWRGAGMVGTRVEGRAVRILYRRLLRAAFRDALDVRDLAIDGDDLRDVGIPPGPSVGKILQRLLDAVLDDPGRNTADWLLQEAQRLHREGLGPGRST